MEVAAPPACSASTSSAIAGWSATTYLTKPYSYLSYISTGYPKIRHPWTRWVSQNPPPVDALGLGWSPKNPKPHLHTKEKNTKHRTKQNETRGKAENGNRKGENGEKNREKRRKGGKQKVKKRKKKRKQTKQSRNTGKKAKQNKKYQPRNKHTYV